ncbi:MAG: acyl-CoA/acyl-ACP dehydrogenase [Mogibacterium sp.]|nr:acyl-CoA/acyl-ACP dehydrogenase [Mogibacterium sp.]
MAESKTYLEAKAFAKEHIAPWSTAVDKENRFATEAFQKIAEAGYLKLIIPEKYGGQGKGVVEHVDVCRAFAEEVGSVGLCYMMHNVFLWEVMGGGREELIELICKDVVENNALCALAHSEFITGIHFYDPHTDAKAEGDYIVINGAKSMVTSGGSAKYYSVNIPSPIAEGNDHMILELGTEGSTFELERWKNAMGMRANVSCPLKLENVRIPQSNRVESTPGTGADIELNVVVPPFVLGLAGIYTGVLKHMLDEAISHATTRKYPSGQTIGQHDLAAYNIAEIYGRQQACLALTNEAVRAYAAGEEDAIAKVLACRMISIDDVIDMSKLAMRIGAGAAYAGMGELSRLTRDAFGGHIMAPGADMLHLWLGRALLGDELIQPERDI